LRRGSSSESCRRLGRAPLTLTPAQIADLASRPWRRDVRELINVLERAVISSDRGEPLHLPPPDATARAEVPPNARAVSAVPALEGAPPRAGDFEMAAVLPEIEMRRRERENLVRAIEHCNGRIYGPDGAAALLGVKPTTLFSRVKCLHLFPGARRSL
jgi:DNA-binding NtrC family response regulator